MTQTLLHVFRKGERPFRTLSALATEDALDIMSRLYAEGSAFWERFKDPREYLAARKQIERNLRDGFTRKGGRPKSEYPIYFVLGRPKWFAAVSDPITAKTTGEIEVPIEIIARDQISFTYPDSMVSALMELEKNPAYYEPEYHGKVFTLEEMEGIIEKKGLPGEGWQTRMPKHLAHYIEAQVWDAEPLEGYLWRQANERHG